ncbi:MAG: sigma-70 family RNA polymerase sigma factor [Chloroflexi bacterium]|nr:sigma-70 family RNA polymerase sigma factor [Chloroflexota bacterium]
MEVQRVGRRHHPADDHHRRERIHRALYLHPHPPHARWLGNRRRTFARSIETRATTHGKEVSLDGLESSDDPSEIPSERFASDDPHPEAIAERKDAASLVERILAEELTPRQRAVLTAIGVKGAPMDEVAKRMGTNRNALYKMMHDARLRMRRRLKREGFEPEELLDLFGN